MAFITLRQANVVTAPNATIKGSPLTNAEIDNNFANINVQLVDVSNSAFSLGTTINNLSSSEISNGTSSLSVLEDGDLIVTGNIVPATNVTYNLGNADFRFKDLFLSGNTIDLGGVTIKAADGFIKINDNNAITTNGDIASANVRLLSGDNFVELRANAELASNIIFNFPTTDGTVGQALVTDAAGNLSFAAAGATLEDDTSTDNTFYPVITDSTTGSLTSAKVSSTKLNYNPSTGKLYATNVNNIPNVTPANGQIVIGNGTEFVANTITGTSNQITVTNGAGAITLSTPQSIATSSDVQFDSFGVGTAASGTTGEIRATNNITAFYSDRRLKTNITPIADALKKDL